MSWRKNCSSSSYPVSVFFTAKYWPAQWGHNDFDYAKDTAPGFFSIVTGAKSSDLYIADVSHNNVDMPMEKKQMIANLIELNVITISAHFLSFGHGYLQHADRA